MTEVAFARQFLTTLDSRPQKLSSDHVADPKTLPAQAAYILPRIQHPYTIPSQRSTSNSEQTSPTSYSQPSSGLIITLSPLRQTPTSPAPVKIPAQSRTSIYDLKTQVASRTGYAPDKLKILWERKPVTDSKTVSEATGAQTGSVEMGVMYIGAPTSTPVSDQKQAAPSSGQPVQKKPKPEASETSIAQGLSGKAVLDTPEFWKDLSGFMVQRVRDKAVAEETVKLWQDQWGVRK